MRIGGVLPYYYEVEPGKPGMTALAGLPPYLDLAQVAKVRESVERHIHLLENGQGWTAAQLVTHAVLLNLSGGDCVDDLDRLNADAGLGEVVRGAECAGMTRQQRREMERRFRKGRERSIASPSAMRRFLEGFHDEEQEQLRAKAVEKAFIPRPNEHLRGLYQVNWDLVAFAQSRKRQRTATLDIDAVVIETAKEEALYCYEKTKAYQPLNIYWAEHGLVVHSEFRDGNVPAGHQIQRVLDEFLAHLPPGVEEVSVRSDTAAYEIALLHYLHSGGNGRLREGEQCKPIWFALGVPITKEFKEAAGKPAVEWEPLGRKGGDCSKAKREWAEVGFVSNGLARSKNDPEFRFIAIREPLEQLSLPGMEGQQKLPFPTVVFEGRTYKLHAIVTNRPWDWDGARVIRWYHERCGKSEEAHAVMQDDLAGGQLPSKRFGANAAWWAMMILALNLNQIMKKLVLGGKWAEKRMKAMRFAAINTPGRVLRGARQLCLRVSEGCAELVRQMREGVAALAAAPG